MRLLFKVCCLLLLTIETCYAIKVLGIFPVAGTSQFTTNNAVMKSLIEAGHQVTVVTPFPQKAASENYTSIIDSSKGEFIYVGQSSFQDVAALSVWGLTKLFVEVETSYCNKVVKLPQIRDMLNSDEKLFDVVFVEMINYYKCYFYIAEKMKIPVIGVVTCKTWSSANNAIGNPHPLAYIPLEMTEWKSADDFYSRTFLQQFYKDNVEIFASKDEFLKIEPALIFYNNHPTFLPRPMVPNAIDIGGISLNKAKPLPEDLEKFINEAEHGVILFSFGSRTRAALLPEDVKNAFRDAFAEVPQRVIWKYEENMENLSPNVMLMEWLPQRDILEHVNVKAFISHCGQGGTYEAIQTATPVVAVPLFTDQLSNAAILVGSGVAIRLDINNLSKNIILNELNTIVNDTRYNDNMQKLSKSFKDRPMTPQQSVVYWTEYVVRHNGAPHLKNAATELNWFKYFLLDVLGFLALSSFLMLYLTFRVIKTMNFNFHRVMTKCRKNCKNKAL